MRILYSLPHPADRLRDFQSGHTIRATALLRELKKVGNDIFTIEAANVSHARSSVGIYRKLIKRLLPRTFSMIIRDFARIRFGQGYAEQLIKTITDFHPDVLLETHIAFSLSGKIASERTGIPLVIDDCAPAWEEEQHYGVGLRRRALKIHHTVTRHANLLIAVNNTLYRYLLEEGHPLEKVMKIENGFDANIFHPFVDGLKIRFQYNISDAATVIVFVGSFQEFHRVDLLLLAFSKLCTQFQNLYLLLVGEGKKYEESKALATQLNLRDKTIFTSSVQYECVPEFLAAGDIAIIPATDKYTNPKKVYEYMALGKPVVAPNQHNITEVVTHGKDAYLFRPEDVGSMTAALKTMIESPELREKLGQGASRLASENTWEKRALALQKALEGLLI